MRAGNSSARRLEHFVFMELNAHRSYHDLHYGISFWRTKSGLEVDFILGDGEVAIEVKGSSRVDKTDMRSLRAYMNEFKTKIGDCSIQRKTRTSGR